ncbi:LysO family transporter [Schnuerera ultunensis]|uniref:LysO family transporter n=1 Tax=Schnuerera ultunensis TaxID=45497 RepID=UPI0004279659|nr:LysO family transporter [Schnuerera ultunensis]
MGIRLLIYLTIIAIGTILGYEEKISTNVGKKLNLIQNICLFFLLFIMGIRIGLDEKVIKSLLSIGYRAGIIAISTIFFTLLVIKILTRFIILKEGENRFEP